MGKCPCPASRDARCRRAALQAGGDGVLQVGMGHLICWGPPQPWDTSWMPSPCAWGGGLTVA